MFIRNAELKIQLKIYSFFALFMIISKLVNSLSKSIYESFYDIEMFDGQDIGDLETSLENLKKIDQACVILLIVSSLLALRCTVLIRQNQYSFWQIKRHENAIRRLKDIEVSALEDKFSQLNDSQKNALVKQGLAMKDGAGIFYLKYICPISRSLIREPIKVFVQHRDMVIGELFDKLSFKEVLAYNPTCTISPVSGRKFVMDGDGKPITKESAYLLADSAAYIHKLKLAVEAVISCEAGDAVIMRHS